MTIKHNDFVNDWLKNEENQKQDKLQAEFQMLCSEFIESVIENNKIKQIITNESKSLLKTIQYQKSKGNIRRIKNKTIDFQYNDLPIIDIKKGKQTITLYFS